MARSVDRTAGMWMQIGADTALGPRFFIVPGETAAEALEQFARLLASEDRLCASGGYLVEVAELLPDSIVASSQPVRPTGADAPYRYTVFGTVIPGHQDWE